MRQQPLSVLLVDDDLDAQSVFELVMQHYNVPFNIVGDAETALDFLKTNTPDIVVMDIFLPGMDGYQALDRIRRTTTASGSRVIATTAYYTNDTQQEVIRRGFDGYVPKPFDEGLVGYFQRIMG
ncbi:MAG: response regulator [Anaerolineae bacterium]|nr:response regulator [Anaerolineae bacterium]